jgi:hypothetical protein
MRVEVVGIQQADGSAKSKVNEKPTRREPLPVFRFYYQCVVGLINEIEGQ